MALKEEILQMFSARKGEYLSGEEIARQLSVTRSAVWKGVKALREAGYPIKAVTNRGYILPESTDLLSAGAVRQYLAPETGPLTIQVYPTLPSTNQTAKELAASGAPEGIVILSEEQTLGRGRKGRVFYSPARTGLYMSMLLRPACPVSAGGLLTAAAAVAVAQAVEQLSGRETQLKWVNDVLIGGKKICGILTEASVSVESGGMEYAVIGAGINVYPPPEGFPPELIGKAEAVYPDGSLRGEARSRLAGEILNRFFAYYRRLEEKSFLPDYRRRMGILGKTVTVSDSQGSRKAKALAVDDSCRLLVRYEDGREEALSSGEVSVSV